MPERPPPTSSSSGKSSRTSPTGEGGGPLGDLGDAFTRRYGPLPGWAWASIIAAGGALFIVLRRRRAAGELASRSGSMPTGADPFWGEGAGGYPGGVPGSEDKPPTPVPIGVPFRPPESGGTSSTSTRRTSSPERLTSPLSASSLSMPRLDPSPLSSSITRMVEPIPQAVISSGVIRNVASGENRGPYYSPSLLDLLTTRPEGLSYSRVATSGDATKNQGSYSTVYTNAPKSAGTGPIVTADKRIPGEVYVPIGGGKYQVVL